MEDNSVEAKKQNSLLEERINMVVKYTTHLKGETIKELKRHALDNDLKDYQVMQEAVEMYLKAK